MVVTDPAQNEIITRYGNTFCKEYIMIVHAVIPFRPSNPKTRLSSLLSEDERCSFADGMLSDVIDAVRGANCKVTLLSTEPYEAEGADLCVKALGLNEALNEYFSEVRGPVLVIMSDLPLATPDAILRVTETDADCALVPGRGGGTNVIYLKDPSQFRADFYGASFLDHCQVVEEYGLSCEVIDSFRLSTDIDEKEDLVEILLHSRKDSACRAFLDGAGILLSTNSGRVTVERRTDEKAL